MSRHIIPKGLKELLGIFVSLTAKIKPHRNEQHTKCQQS